MPTFLHIITLVFHPDGRLRITSDKISVADAERWVTEGHHVLRVAVARERGSDAWAVNHVGTGEVIQRPKPPTGEHAAIEPLQLEGPTP